MLTYLIYKLISKYLKANTRQATRIRHILQSAVRLLLPLILCLLFLKAIGQESRLEYKVIRNNKVIGHTTVTGLKEPGKVTYRIKAEITVSIIKDFKAISNEETIFKNGIMVSSFFSRSLNGSAKGKRQTQLIDSIYKVVEDGKITMHHFGKINLNISSLYLNEPLDTKRIYSDNHQRWLELKQIKPHSYRLDLPDGNHTLYHFENGVCARIDIIQTFFNAQLVLVNRDQVRTKIHISSSY